MPFLEVGTAPKVIPKKQRLYLMCIVLKSGLTVIKIGKASGKSSKDRMLQICASIYDVQRTTPAITIKKDTEVPAEDVFKLETTLHRYFADYQYSGNERKWDGKTEMFVIPLDDAIQAYEAVISGLVPECKYVLPEAPVVATSELPF